MCEEEVKKSASLIVTPILTVPRIYMSVHCLALLTNTYERIFLRIIYTRINIYSTRKGLEECVREETAHLA
jgi:hypothetical protein